MGKVQWTLGLLLLAFWAAPAGAENNWGQWRGPNFNGSSPAKNLPEQLTVEGALWSTAMPGHSNGTPVIWGDRVFVTAGGGGKLTALCLSRTDGKIVWQKDVAEAVGKKGANDFATPSPVTDGKMVIFLFGSGDLEAFDYEGKSLWKRNLQKDHGKWNYQWLYGASPLLYKGKLYVPVLHRDVDAGNWTGGPKAGESLADSYLLAINPETGADLWKHIRPNDARVETKESYGTPIPWERPSGTQILLNGGDCVTGHDPETGAEIWRAGGWNPKKENHWRLVPSPLTFEELVYVCPPKGGMIRAFREGGHGDVTASHLAWQATDLTTDAAVPLIYDGHLYVLDGDKKKNLACVDPKTGQRQWTLQIDSKSVIRSSPTGADGKIYAMNEAGDLFVFSATEAKLLSKVSLGGEGGARGTIAAVDGMIVARTGDKVWAFGKAGK